MKSKTVFIIIVAILILAVIYLVQNGGFLAVFSLGNYLWVGIFLLCPLMHLFMMKGHNHSSQNSDHESKEHDH